MSWIVTYTGRRFDLLAPRAEDVDMRDIAHALANLCRFNGHCRRHYSVAQHSVLVSHLVPEEYALFGLLHDAGEAYVGDVLSPLKAVIPEFGVIEARVMAAIAERFALPWPFESPAKCAIKHADLVALATERRDLITHHPDPWPCLAGVLPMVSVKAPAAWNADHAEWMFMQRFEMLFGCTYLRVGSEKEERYGTST